MRTIPSILASAFALLAAPAATQPPAPPPSEPEIVVEGRRVDGRQLDTFIDALSNVRADGTIARFAFPVCPLAVGMTPAHNDAITSRLRAVAAAAGVPLAPAHCRPNLLVIVARDNRTMIDDMRRNYPLAFVGFTPVQSRRLAATQGPVAWHVEGRLDAEGVPLTPDPFTGAYNVGSPLGPSRLTPTLSPHFHSAVLVVEARAVAGFTPRQLADYAAMRTFAKIDPATLPGDAPASILTLFTTPAGRPVPITLTHWDLSYLRALYAAPLNRFASSQRFLMRRQMLRDLEQVGEAE